MTKYDYRQFLGCLYLWQLQMCGETPYRGVKPKTRCMNFEKSVKFVA